MPASWSETVWSRSTICCMSSALPPLYADASWIIICEVRAISRCSPAIAMTDAADAARESTTVVTPVRETSAL
jgi:hypothetical protein